MVTPFQPPPLSTEELPVAVRELTLGPAARRAFVVDNLVDPAALKLIHDEVLGLSYEFIESDRRDTRFARHLVHYFEEDEFETNSVVSGLLQRSSALLEQYELDWDSVQRVYVNFNLFGDFHFAHHDGHVWTALFFVNSTWHEDWGGEFLLYEDGPQSLAYAIQPRPGRMVLFDGALFHRGGSPSKYCLDARVTLAIKFERS